MNLLRTRASRLLSALVDFIKVAKSCGAQGFFANHKVNPRAPNLKRQHSPPTVTTTPPTTSSLQPSQFSKKPREPQQLHSPPRAGISKTICSQDYPEVFRPAINKPLLLITVTISYLNLATRTESSLPAEHNQPFTQQHQHAIQTTPSHLHTSVSQAQRESCGPARRALLLYGLEILRDGLDAWDTGARRRAGKVGCVEVYCI
ncbi:predicted protein [Plenodomus lingam JN3]|uniref:Predicted protein n=1 Tax=Leptosphaeria maculans (strain JN3 / isolate v23.1.3 / race Av1-4-5-6-7-8) TaxID=985895 RepID=E4ZUT2_LEPMJ|nr:predicted protein [Plenodomus lingam JN3]CBX95161.1 predicted protein [Plenodomus lingam JN3]